MRLPEIDDLPVIFAGHGIGVALAQKAYVVGVLQLIDGRRVASEFLVVELDGACVLLSAVDQLIFAVTLNGGCHARGGDGEGNQK